MLPSGIVHTHGSPDSLVPEKIITNPTGFTPYERMGGHEGLHRLVDSFYAKVRHDPLLAPVFSAHIEDWPEHIEKITGFWARMTGGPSEWNGGMGRHFFLEIGAEHFVAWLKTWDENCRALLPESEAAEMSGLAHRIGQDLETMLSRRKRGPLA